MDRRFSFIVNYRNPLMGGRAWKDITEAILAFDIQNESEGHGPSMYSNRNWICDRAKKVRPQVRGPPGAAGARRCSGAARAGAARPRERGGRCRHT